MHIVLMVSGVTLLATYLVATIFYVFKVLFREITYKKPEQKEMTRKEYRKMCNRMSHFD